MTPPIAIEECLLPVGASLHGQAVPGPQTVHAVMIPGDDSMIVSQALYDAFKAHFGRVI